MDDDGWMMDDVIGHRSSVIDHRSSVIGHRLSVTPCAANTIAQNKRCEQPQTTKSIWGRPVTRRRRSQSGRPLVGRVGTNFESLLEQSFKVCRNDLWNCVGTNCQSLLERSCETKLLTESSPPGLFFQYEMETSSCICCQC